MRIINSYPIIERDKCYLSLILQILVKILSSQVERIIIIFILSILYLLLCSKLLLLFTTILSGFSIFRAVNLSHSFQPNVNLFLALLILLPLVCLLKLRKILVDLELYFICPQQQFKCLILRFFIYFQIRMTLSFCRRDWNILKLVITIFVSSFYTSLRFRLGPL